MGLLINPAPKEVKSRVDLVLKALVAENNLEVNLLIRQTANWTKAKRRQFFREILQTIIAKPRVFSWDYIGVSIREKGLNAYQVNDVFFKSRYLEAFIEHMKKMEDADRFIPEKVYTLSKLQANMLSLDPSCFEYLLEKKIVVLGESFEITSFKVNNLKNIMYTFRYASRSIDRLKEYYVEKGYNHEILMSPEKSQLVAGYRISQNIKNIMRHLFKEKERDQSKIRNAIMQGIVQLQSCDRALSTGHSTTTGMADQAWATITDLFKDSRGTPNMPEHEYYQAAKNLKLDSMDIQMQLTTKLIGMETSNDDKVEGENIFDPSTAVL